ncbi:hypothetical protein LCGC14_3012100, partial [marine sediment metagenome]
KVYLTKKGMHQPFNRQPMLQGQTIADASQTKTLKAMAEWLQPYIVERYNDWCRYVIPTQAVFALREGEMPWEGKDAVHTARKTPRTIPPD